MCRLWRYAVAFSFLLVAGCAREAYGVFGDVGDVYSGQMTSMGGGGGRLELDNGKGTRCLGDFVDNNKRPSVGTGLVGLIVAAAEANSSSGRVWLTCTDGHRALIQFTSLGLSSGYGFGTTDGGRPVRFTYGLSRDESTPYLQVPTTRTAAAGKTNVIATGSGFYITRQGHVLTNAHVVKGCKSLTIARVGESATTASVVSVDKQNDLAVLMAAAPAPAVAALQVRPVRQGEAVVAFGFPYAGSLSSGGSITTGSINALSGLGDDTRYLQISAPVQPGNSGGPLLDGTGAVVGVVSSALRTNRATGIVPQNVNFAIKVDVVRTFLTAAGVTAENTTGGRDLSTPDIGEHARAFSVLIDCKG